MVEQTKITEPNTKGMRNSSAVTALKTAGLLKQAGKYKKYRILECSAHPYLPTKLIHASCAHWVTQCERNSHTFEGVEITFTGSKLPLSIYQIVQLAL
jgi:hypothetical protein